MTAAFSGRKILLELGKWKSRKASPKGIPESNSKKEIGDHLTAAGYDPADFDYCYLVDEKDSYPFSSSHMVTCSYRELPENLECFLCRSTGDRAVIFDYHRHRGPRIARRG